MMGAARAAETIVAILTLNSGIVAPTVGYREPDPVCGLNYVSQKAVQVEIRLAFSLSLGFGGYNACLTFYKTEETA